MCKKGQLELEATLLYNEERFLPPDTWWIYLQYHYLKNSIGFDIHCQWIWVIFLNNFQHNLNISLEFIKIYLAQHSTSASWVGIILGYPQVIEPWPWPIPAKTCTCVKILKGLETLDVGSGVPVVLWLDCLIPYNLICNGLWLALYLNGLILGAL